MGVALNRRRPWGYTHVASKPKWSPKQIATTGRAALELAQTYQADIADRLQAGLVDALEVALDVFEGKRSEAARSTESLRTATEEQNAAAAKAHTFLSAARAAIVRSGASAAERAAFGVKLTLKSDRVSSLVACLDAIIDGGAKYPAAASAAGLLSADFARATALRDSLTSADASQETAKATRKSPVAARKAAQVTIEDSIDAIINAGTLAFIDAPDKAEQFRNLIP